MSKMKKNFILIITIVVLYSILAIGLHYGVNSDIDKYFQNPSLLRFRGSAAAELMYADYIKFRPVTALSQVLFSISSIFGVLALLFFGSKLFLRNKPRFVDLLQACLISEFVCILHTALNLLGLYTGFLHDGIQSVGSPLLLFQSHNWDIWLINAFNNINIFWITYIVVLILAIKNNCKLTHKQSSIVVLGSYVSVILLFTVIICLTLILQTGNTPQQFTPDITTN